MSSHIALRSIGNSIQHCPSSNIHSSVEFSFFLSMLSNYIYIYIYIYIYLYECMYVCIYVDVDTMDSLLTCSYSIDLMGKNNNYVCLTFGFLIVDVK